MYSKKTYAQNQLLVLFKDYQNQHYLEFIEDVRNIEQFQELQNLSINSDGFTNEYRSLYFFGTNRELRKQFLNISIFVDAELQVITGFFISNSRIHDA